MLEMINQKLELLLFKCGFAVSSVRRLVRDQVYVTAVICFIALIMYAFTPWPLHFAAGTLLLAGNLFLSARFGQRILFFRQSKLAAVINLLARFYIRLACTAVIAYILIVRMGVSGLAMLAGAVVLAGSILFLAWIQFAGRKVKEV